LLRLDWMEIVRKEIPDLVVDNGEEYSGMESLVFLFSFFLVLLF